MVWEQGPTDIYCLPVQTVKDFRNLDVYGELNPMWKSQCRH